MPNRNLKWLRLSGILIILIFMLLSFKEAFFMDDLDQAVYEFESGFLAPPGDFSHRIVVVEIDDDTIKTYGQPWIWLRRHLAQVVDILNNDGVRLIGINIPLLAEERHLALSETKVLQEKIRTQPFARKNPTTEKWLLENLTLFEQKLDVDRRLAESIQKAGNVILLAPGQKGKGSLGPKGQDLELVSGNVLKRGTVPEIHENVHSLSQVIPPLPLFSSKALGIGFSSEATEVTKASPNKYPMVYSKEALLLPSFPLRLAIAYHKQRPETVVVEDRNIRLNTFSIPLYRGELLIRADGGRRAFKRYSFGNLLESGKPTSSLRGRIVLLGFNTENTRPYLPTESQGLSSNQYAAYVLDTILRKTFITRPPFARYIELSVMAVLGVLAILIFPQKRAFNGFLWMAGLGMFILLSGGVLFIFADVWFKTAGILCCLFAIYFSTLLWKLGFKPHAEDKIAELNRSLGLRLQNRGHLDLALERYKELPLDKDTKELFYNLGRDFEDQGLLSEALAAYEYLAPIDDDTDLARRITELNANSGLASAEPQESAREIYSNVDASIRVGPYHLFEELGRGPIGKVYEALDSRNERTLALKTLRLGGTYEENVISSIKEWFFREAKMARRLSHPLMVPVYDFGEEEDLIYLAMELLKGQELSKFTKKENLLPLRKVLNLVGDIAEALDFAHKAGFLHGNLKPSNVILLDEDRLNLTDFGVSRPILSSRTKSGEIIAIPEYMSPEQIMGQMTDSRSDIFSLGILFYQLLTGELPFQEKNLDTLLHRITQEKHPPLSDYNPKVPKVCEQIADKALAKDRQDRFASAGEMVKVIRYLVSRIDQGKEKKS